MDQWYRSIISGERAGVIPALIRGTFLAASWAYGGIIKSRNFLYDRQILKPKKLSVPVISVGNITTGGTGKTPTVIMIARELQRLGKKPAVLTRGYKAPKGQKPDEVMVIEAECPGVPVVVNKSRIEGGKTAIEKYGADVLILDDGFQHRKLHRDLNIVLIDTTEPLGVPGMTPRGTWREHPSNLQRADLIILTRCEQVTPQLVDYAANLLSQWVTPRDIFLQRTLVSGVHDGAGTPVSPKPDTRVIAFAGIGNPDGFLHTARSLNLAVSAACWFDDHHNYKLPADFAPLEKLTAEREVAAWVTTLKDFVKLKNVKTPVPLWHIRIHTRLEGHGEDLFRERLEKLFATKSEP
jgi:tetraacyldisaccharide 4'-kinase